MKQTILTTISIYDRVQTVDCIRERKCGQIVTLSTLSARWACFVYFFCFLANWNLFDTSRGGVKTFYWPWLKPPVLRAQLPSGPDDHECEPGGRAKYSLGQDRKQVKMRNRSVQCWLTRFLQKVDRIVTINREIQMRLSENYMSILQNKLGQRSWSGAEVHRVRRPGSHSWRGKLSRPRRCHRRHCPSRPGYHW